MLIRMRSTAAGPDFLLPAGAEAEVSDDIGTTLVEAGYAEDLSPKPEKRKITRSEVLRRKTSEQ